LQERGIGYDPLTTNEADRVLALALAAEEEGVAQSADHKAAHPIEILSVERYDAPKGAQGSGATARQGNVYLYEYATDTLIHTIVDVDSGLLETERVQGVQLPLTPREKARALQIIQDDADLWSALAGEYRLITGETLNNVAQLESKVSLFLGNAMPDQSNAAAQQCGQQRCAQVLLFTVERTLFDVLPIVNLSQGKVIQLLGESWDATVPSEKAGE